jgi:hypothetical protein
MIVDLNSLEKRSLGATNYDEKRDAKRHKMAAICFCEFKDSKTNRPRLLSNVATVQGACLDIDEFGEFAKDWRFALTSFPYACYWYTTASHTDKIPRARLLVPFSTPISTGAYPLVWKHLNDLLSGLLDTQAKDPARLGFLPGYVWQDDQPFERGTVNAPLYNPASAATAATAAPAPARTRKVNYASVMGLTELLDAATKLKHHTPTKGQGEILLRLLGIPDEDIPSLPAARKPYNPRQIIQIWPTGKRHDKLRDALFFLARKLDLEKFGTFEDVWPYLITRCTWLGEATGSTEFSAESVSAMWAGAVSKLLEAKANEKREKIAAYCSEVYTDEEIAAWIEPYAGIESVDDLVNYALLTTADGRLLVFRRGIWIQRQHREDLYRLLGMFGERVPLFEIGRDGGLCLKSQSSIVRDSGQPIEEVATSLTGPYGFFNEHFDMGDKLPRFVQPPKHRRAWKDPYFDPEVDQWLTMFFGDQKPLIDRWICLSQDHSLSIPALYLVAESSVGKSLIRGGLGRLWGKNNTGCLDSNYFGRFNGEFEKCPYVIVDDKQPHPETTTGAIRDFVTTVSHSINPKFGSKTTIEGHGRFIVLANNPNVIAPGEEEMLTEADINAIQQRFLFLDLRDKTPEDKIRTSAIRDYLETLGRGGRDELAEKVAQHFYWLGQQKVETLPDESQFRFSKDVGRDLIPYISKGSSAASWAAQFLVSYCTHAADSDYRWLAHARIHDHFRVEFHEVAGELTLIVPLVLVTSGFRVLLEKVDKMEAFPRRVPSASEFEWALYGLSDGEVEDNRRSGQRFLISMSSIEERAVDPGRLTLEKKEILLSRLTT